MLAFLMCNCDKYRGHFLGPIIIPGVIVPGIHNEVYSVLCTTELFSILENMLIGYPDDFTLMAVVSSPGNRVIVAESLKHHFGEVV